MAENNLNDMTARAIAGEAIIKVMADALRNFGQLRSQEKVTLETHAADAAYSLHTGNKEIDDAVLVHIRDIMSKVASG